MEEEFLQEYRSRSVRFIRQGLLLGAAFYMLFGILDAVLAPEIKYQLWFIRYAVVVPVLLIFIVFSYHPAFSKYAQGIVTFALLLAGSGISLMVAIAPDPARYSYYAGVILVLMLGYGYTRTRFIWATVAGWLNIIIYEIIAIWIVKTPGSILINNNFFFISANLIGMFSCYSIEYFTRRDFFLARMLDVEKEKVSSLNRNLESKVKKRTKEIRKAHEELLLEMEAHHKSEEERKELEKKLFQAQKMESIGNLAGGIAHDFNNILASLIGFTELSIEKIQHLTEENKNAKDKETALDYLNHVLLAGARAADVVSQILAFARKSEKVVEPLEIRPVIEEVLSLIRSSIPSSIEILREINTDACVMANSTEIHQILMNLCTNAAFAMRVQGGILNITVNDIQDDHGNSVEIRIMDTGEGISEEAVDSIFEPYFTTKNAGEGTGLGLAVVHGIIESYGGSIEVESVEGKGTAFTIRIPSTERICEEKPAGHQEIIRGSERILYIDDEPSITEFVQLILEGLGYTVLCVNDSREAIRIFREEQEEYDLIISDMTMPGLGGEMVAEAVFNLRPELPVILCSGNFRSLSLNQAAAQNVKAILNKPFTKAEIAGAVRRVLDERLETGF